MQMLQSLLFAAARRTSSEDARRVLDEASGRTAAMAAAQRVLYGTTDATCFFAESFLAAVVETIHQMMPNISIDRSPASGTLSNDIAMPLALILNELLTNAAKHGIADPPRGRIRVGLMDHGGSFELYVEDDGPGFDLEEARKTSSGLRLVLGLAVRCIFAAAHDDQQVRARAEPFAPLGWLTKPYTMPSLINLVQASISAQT
ncbi:sensor histidine kinase [Bradyrhizobium jicamae]|uniref:sensor histidine kinase n=1 Tax=Bradyrhizobium jicamae TaxID=280332 RepID=UPI00289D12BC|nr:sensor histidine kinase [Bradyrhizobium jicamae]